MRENRCERCKHFYQRNLKPYGLCMKTKEPYKVHELDACADFKRKSYKVKPRRLCDFCERGKRMESEEGEHDLRLVKLTPIKPINLTSGETAEKAEPPHVREKAGGGMSIEGLSTGGSTIPDGYCAADVSDFIVAPTCNLIVKQSDGAECLKWHSVSDRSKRPVCNYTDDGGKTTMEAEIVIAAVKNAIDGMPYCFAIYDPRTCKWVEAIATFSGVILRDIRGQVTHWAELPTLPKEGTE